MRFVGLVGLVGILCACAPDEPIPLTPRTVVTPPSVRPVMVPAGPLRAPELVVKFADAAQVRAPTPDALRSAQGVDLRHVEAVRDRYGLRFAPVFDVAAPKLEGLRDRARQRTGRAQPDLLGALRVEVPSATPQLLAEVGGELQRLSAVEFAYIHDTRLPPPADIAPATPQLDGFQTYVGSESGIGADAAAAMGLDGSGVHIADVEQNWDFDHEEWNDFALQLEEGVTIWPDNDDGHGTAVIGTLISGDNGYGITGMTPGAAMTVYPELIGKTGTFRRADAIASAAADAAEGDVVLLEIQDTDPVVGEFAPGEIDEMVWMITRMATDAGVVVVAAAGNGNVDLDSVELGYYRDRGDSGAIIVGAGSPTTRDKLNFSTFGSRVDLQGWGTGVFTTGYGDYAQYGGDVHQRYTQSFSGTSSASPIVTAAAALVQQAARQGPGNLTSAQMRLVLKNTGLPQGSGGNIGPLPQVAAAAAAAGIEDLAAPSLSFVTPESDVAVEQTSYETGIVVDATDDSGVVVSVQISINGDMQPVIAEVEPFTFESVSFPEGSWEVIAFGTDVWGNVGESAPLTIAVGVEPVPESTGDMGESSSGGGTGPAPPDETAPLTDDDGDDGDGTDTDEPGAAPRGEDGCGCRSGPPSSVWWLLAVAGFGLHRRRRLAQK